VITPTGGARLHAKALPTLWQPVVLCYLLLCGCVDPISVAFTPTCVFLLLIPCTLQVYYPQECDVLPPKILLLFLGVMHAADVRTGVRIQDGFGSVAKTRPIVIPC
jgi:hypothetical protein